ncbi:UDP-glycosyltransferase 78d2 [Phtheirospermum japonicum]|uniref:UDP-glycosyltransferase 78d2 n=1 Tax=Phtheirospermum japonicum TaxID=374723 RepID=A0A830CCU2_9LAMI|nr:UDP-glycosyltransferase 78d2 [Phtheirospermum japonicum]
MESMPSQFPNQSHTLVYRRSLMVIRAKADIYKPKTLCSELLDFTEPKFYIEALQHPKWKAALEEEYNALLKNKTWTLSSLPHGKSLVGCKWVFKLKKHVDGIIERYKAGLVVRGYNQNNVTQLLDFEENLNMPWRLQLNLTVPHLLLSPPKMSDNLKDKVSQLGGNQRDKLIEEATVETLDGPDLATNLEICDMINRDRVNSVELIRSVKRRLILKSPMAQYLSLLLLKTIVKNCDRAFAEVAAESVLDEIVRLIDNPHAASLKTRGIRFPGWDNDILAPIFTSQRSPNAILRNNYIERSRHKAFQLNKSRRRLMWRGIVWSFYISF